MQKVVFAARRHRQIGTHSHNDNDDDDNKRTMAHKVMEI